MNSNRPRIAYVLQDFSIGGVQTGIYNVVNLLQDEFEFHFIASHVPYIHPRFKALGHTSHIPQPWDLVKYLRTNQIDLAQIQNVPYYTDCVIASRVPTIVERISMDRSASNSKHGVDWVIASSHGTIPLIEKTIDPTRITVIYNGTDLTKFRSLNPNRMGFSPDDVVIGRVSRIGSGKNLQMLLRAMDKIRLRHLNAKLVVVGDRTRRNEQKDMWPELKALAEPLGPNVVFTGEVDQPFNIMAGFDIATCVSSSGNEGIPNSLIEAMALGTPVVSTNVGQIDELVEQDINGLLVPNEDLESLTDALERLVVDPELRAKLGEAGHKKVAKHFNIETQARQYAELYYNLLNTSPRANVNMPRQLPVNAKKAAFGKALRRLSNLLSGYSIVRNLLPLAIRHDPIRGGPYLIAKLLLRCIRRSPRLSW